MAFLGFGGAFIVALILILIGNFPLVFEVGATHGSLGQ